MSFEPSLFTNKPHKTYTLSWKHKPFFGSTLSRVRFDYKCVYWPWKRFYHELQFDEIFAFCALLSRGLGDFRPLRLTKSGKLVARSATYRGV